MSEAASVFSVVREAIAGSIPVSVVTVVSGEGAGQKLAVLPDRTVGTLGSGSLDELAIPAARGLLDDERSLTQAYPTESASCRALLRIIPSAADTADLWRGPRGAGVGELRQTAWVSGSSSPMPAPNC